MLASGLIADLAKRYDAVDLVTCAQNREIAEAIPGLRRRLYTSRDTIRVRTRLARLGIAWVVSEATDREVFRHLETHTYDLAICLRRYVRQSSLILMSKVQAAEKHCAWLFPTNASHAMAEKYSRGWSHYRGPLEDRSELVYYRGFLRRALQVESGSGPRLTIAERGQAGQIEAGLVGLVLGGGSTNWPVDHWRELARGLVRAGKRLVLFGGADAAPLAATIRNDCPAAEDCIGRLSFAESTARLARLEMLVGNDTGFTHYASLVVSRCLVILGGGTFGRFFPWPEATNQRVIHHAMECYDCDWQCLYARPECLHRVSAQAVLDYAVATQAESVRNLSPMPVDYLAGWRRQPEGLGVVRLPAGRPGLDH